MSIPVLAARLEEHPLSCPDLLSVEAKSFCAIKAMKHFRPPLNRQWGLRCHSCRSRPGARRIGKDVQIGEGELRGYCSSIAKRGLCLAGESYHDIGSQAHMGKRSNHTFDQLCISSNRMAPVHGGQDVVVTALQWNVEIRTNDFGRSHYIQ